MSPIGHPFASIDPNDDEPIKKRCTPEEHTALRELPQEQWDALKQCRDWDFGDGEVLEQRDCPRCGSTLARPKKEK